MTWSDAFALVVAEFRRRATRTALTVAAVALAATLLTSLVTIAGTAQNRVLSEVSTGGPLAGIKVAAAAPDPSQVDRDDARPGPPKPLDDAAVARIRVLRDVRAIYPVLAVPVLVVGPLHVGPGQYGAPLTGPPVIPGDGPDDPYGESLLGLPLAQAATLPVTLIAGRLPAVGSMTEVVVTPGYLERFHLAAKQADLVVGTRVEIGFPRGFATGQARARWIRPTVVGVAAQDAGPGQFLGSIELAAVGRDWTRAGGVRSAQTFGLQDTTYTGLFVIADRLERVTAVRTRITAVGYSTAAPENLIASVKRYLRVVEIVLAAVSAIALVVAALGIANAMYAAVRERRREIGVLKAIGARDRDVLRIFVIEALMIGLVGGVIGALLGTAVAAVVGVAVNRYLASQGVAGIHLALSGLVLAGAVLGSTLLAVVAGVAPAREAARLPAREAVAE
ncbi:MAG: hypothetical protein NVS3B21_02010 [Acidimicrobiales bacterium]